jgi:hypothetical protein
MHWLYAVDMNILVPMVDMVDPVLLACNGCHYHDPPLRAPARKQGKLVHDTTHAGPGIRPHHSEKPFLGEILDHVSRTASSEGHTNRISLMACVAPRTIKCNNNNN